MNVRTGEMHVPPLWVGCALLFWGIFTDQIVLAVILAVVAEFGVFSPVKWELTNRHFYRAADGTSALFAIIAVYQFNEYSIYAIYSILALLPVCVFPLLVVERYSTRGALPLSALFLSLRRRVEQGYDEERYVGVAVPFILVTVLAASPTEIPGAGYFVGAVVLTGGVLFMRRPGRFHLVTWCACLAAVVVSAYAIQGGVRAAQHKLEDSFSYWVNQFAYFQTNPRRELTSIGSIGRLKLSDRVRVRIDAPLSTPLPLPLREASYSTFNLGMWSAPRSSEFSAIDPLPQTTIWELGPEPNAPGTRTAAIIVDHAEDVGVAPLPYGTVRIEGSEVIEVQQNPRLTTLIEALPGQLQYRVMWRDGAVNSAPPTTAETAIPENYQSVITRIAEEIGLVNDDPDTAVTQVEAFFADNFRYSLIQKGFYPGRTPLGHFLLSERKGHCEYFATATALLLRHAGVPTRYTVGFVVHEYSALEKAFVARARHAHSWVEAYVGGRWQVVDTTPGVWAELESARVSNWQGVQDLWSWVANRYARYQRSEQRLFADLTLWLVPLLVIYVLWRVRSRARSVSADPDAKVAGDRTTKNSELYEVARALERRGFRLAPGDTLRTFFTRQRRFVAAESLLQRVLYLHERSRYSASGLTPHETEEFRRGCDALRTAIDATR